MSPLVYAVGMLVAAGCSYENRPLNGAMVCGPGEPGAKRCPDDYFCYTGTVGADCANTCWKTGETPDVTTHCGTVAVAVPDGSPDVDAPIAVDAAMDVAHDRGGEANATDAQVVTEAGADSGGMEAGVDSRQKATNGGACGAAVDCQSGNCVESVCCDKPCADTCYSCRNRLTASSPDGTCAAIASGLDDTQARCGAATGPATCGNTGHCDGKGACEKYGGTTVCVAAACAGGSFTPASTCDGQGRCAAAAAQDCRGFACTVTGGCATRCTTDADCTSGYCVTTGAAAGTCAAKKIDGAACVTTNECVHGQCVSGICCDTACTCLCLSCATGDTGQPSGQCKPIRSGGPSKGRCSVGTTPCGLDGTCDGNGACRFTASGTTCGSSACTTGRLTPAPTCNGAGMCSAPPAATTCPGSVNCGSATACLPPICTADANCVSGLCVAPSCMPKKANGQTCARAAECTSGFCADGVCCNRACTGSCEVCSSSGACGFVTGAARPGHPACTGGTAPCASTCNGQSAGCAFPGAETSCRSATCANGAATPAATCNSAGACAPLTQIPCTPFICGTTACTTTCSTNAQCATGAACVSGVCKLCAANETICTNACADLNTNGSHCGACGHGCLGGGCVQGQCQPVAVVTGIPTSPAVFGIDDSFVYYTSNPLGSLTVSSAFRVDKRLTATSPPLPIIAEQSFAAWKGVVNGQLIWSAQGPGSSSVAAIRCDVPTCPMTGGTLFAMTSVVPFHSLLPDFISTASVATSPSGPSLTLSWWSQAANPVDSYFDPPTPGGVYSYAFASGSFVYFLAGNGTISSLFDVNRSTKIRAQLAGQVPPDALLVDVNSQSVILYSLSLGTFLRVPLPLGLGTSAPQPVISAAAGSAIEDAARFYWIDGQGTVSSCIPSNCAATSKVLANGQPSPAGFHQDAAALYWGRANPNSVVRLAK